jgi:hypothetical protein
MERTHSEIFDIARRITIACVEKMVCKDVEYIKLAKRKDK